MVTEVQNSEDFERLLESSKTHPVLIFKHSTQCGISDQAYKTFTEFMESADDIIAGIVLVLESRALSDNIADALGILHESPQAILIRDGYPIWNASHRAITADALNRAIYAESPRG
jgi:bacillithiol system protein YtxJ